MIKKRIDQRVSVRYLFDISSDNWLFLLENSYTNQRKEDAKKKLKHCA